MKKFIVIIFLTIYLKGFSFDHFSNSFSRIHVRSFPTLSSCKCIDFEIQQKRYVGLIDTGCFNSMLHKKILNQISQKTSRDFIEWYSGNGHKYTTEKFQVPNVKLGNHLLEVNFLHEDEHFTLKGCLAGPLLWMIAWKVPLMHQTIRDGLIGIDIFQQFTCIFDFPTASLYLTTEENPWLCEEFVSVPCEFNELGVVLNIYTSLGLKRFHLDSGATSSFIRLTEQEKEVFSNPTKIKSPFLKSGEKNYGPWKFLVWNLAADIDGVLGIDFFNKHTICIDFKNQKVYIRTPELGSKERFNYWLKSSFCRS